MTAEAKIAIYISLGSLIISIFSFLFSFIQSRIARKNEKLKAYDKVYHDSTDLLLYHYKKEQNVKFENEDKDFERAVNEFANAHWLEQTYGFNFYIPPHIKTEKEKRQFCNKVSEAYYDHEKEKQNKWFDEFLNYQSPVFHLENEDFTKRYTRLMKYVTENLSYFSTAINESWERMRLLTPEKVKNDYIALKRVNRNACKVIDDAVDDPYLSVLLSIRQEYRELNKTFKTKWAEFWFNVGSRWNRIKHRFNKKFQMEFK